MTIQSWVDNSYYHTETDITFNPVYSRNNLCSLFTVDQFEKNCVNIKSDTASSLVKGSSYC